MLYYRATLLHETCDIVHAEKLHAAKLHATVTSNVYGEEAFIRLRFGEEMHCSYRTTYRYDIYILTHRNIIATVCISP